MEQDKPFTAVGELTNAATPVSNETFVKGCGKPFNLHIKFYAFPKVGDKVRFAFPDRTYEGTVIRVNTDGTYDVQVSG